MNTIEISYAMFGLGGTEMIVILAVVLLLFGPKKLPELARGLGKGLREFKKASSELKETIQDAEVQGDAPAEVPGQTAAIEKQVTIEPELVDVEEEQVAQPVEAQSSKKA